MRPGVPEKFCPTLFRKIKSLTRILIAFCLSREKAWKSSLGEKVRRRKKFFSVTSVQLLFYVPFSCLRQWVVSHPLTLNHILGLVKTAVKRKYSISFLLISEYTVSVFITLLRLRHRLAYGCHYLTVVLITYGNIFLTILPAEYQKISSSNGHLKQYNQPHYFLT